MKRALVVVDYQNDFVNGKLGCEAAKAICPKIAERIDFFKEIDGIIIFTKDYHGTEYPESREGRIFPEHCTIGTSGTDIYSGLLFLSSAGYLVTKKLFKNTFGSNEFEKLIPDDIEAIEICGVATNICVISCVVHLMTLFPKAEIYVNPEACASFDEELHAAALKVMESMGVKLSCIPNN